MSEKSSPAVRNGFCIYINTFCQGPVPVVSDENGYVVFATELEAQREIVDCLQIRFFGGWTGIAILMMQLKRRNMWCL